MLPDADEAAIDAVRRRNAELTKPPGSLGRLEEIAAWVAGWQGKARPSVMRPLVCVFAGNHGVVRHGVSPYPQSVTRQMLENFAAGGAAINQICATYELGFKVFDLALDLPTGDIATEAAFDEKACVATMAFGMEAIAGGTDLLCLGEMGIGNTTIAAAIYAALYGGPATHWVGAAPGSTMPASPARRLWWNRPSPPMPAISGIRSRSCAGWVAARSRPLPVPSWRRGSSASPSFSTVTW